MAEILIGTSGYFYNDWVGCVYPEGTKQKDYLFHYSNLLPTVELNFSYHAIPKSENLSKMLIDGGENLTFSIKAYRTLTHEINYSQWENDAKTYLKAIEPLIYSNRLEAVLFQFPFSFKYENENRRYLDKLLKFFKGVPMAVEFRKADWYSGRVINGMRSRYIPLVSLDMPELPKLPPSIDVDTAPLAYIRLHGRNSEAWWGDDDYVRHDYLYSDSEIDAWAQRIKMISGQTDKILVYFNNHPKGKAVRNAKTLEKMLNIK